jgi:hypothetical protein
MRLANYLSRTTHVIAMCLAIEQNLRIFPAKTQLFNARAYWRRRSSEVCVDQDIALRGDYEVAGKVLTSHAVEVVSNLEGRNGSCPQGVCVCMDEYGRAEKEKQ